VLMPVVAGDWWTIAGDPDLGHFTSPDQQPVDFGVWQAADGSWQLWSCIRQTKCGGKTRLFFRWEAERLTDPDWRPLGIAMQADPGLGETPGGLQSPFVLTAGGAYYMLYGDWEHICLATSDDGKAFHRHCGPECRPALFSEGAGWNTRDPMVLRVNGLYHCYYTAYPNHQGAIYCRTSPDLITWSDSRRVAFGGAAGTGPFTAECPFVVHQERDGCYYLLRTQRYGADAQTTVYRSRDPLDFGVESDDYRIGTLPVAAPEFVTYEGEDYLACLRPDLKGIRVARVQWR
jgi:hypothetical protein